MAKRNILKEFLVGIGFKVDEHQWKRFDEQWKKTGKRFVELGAQASAASLEITAAVTAIADQLTNLYYISQRTGAGVGALQAYQYGAKQVGVSAEQATAALESLAQTMRLQPGTRGLLASFGINPDDKDTLKTLMKVLDVTRRMPYYQGAAIAGMLGIDEQTFLMLTKNYDELKKRMSQRDQMARVFGVNADDLAKTSRRFTNDLREVEERLEVLGLVLAKDFLPFMEKAVELFDRAMQLLGPLDQKTHGWSTKLIALATALLSVNRALAAGRWGLKTLGIGRGIGIVGGAAEGVEAAAGGAATGAGGGALGTLALPVIIVAAVGAALTWMTLHPDKVRAGAKAVGRGIEKLPGLAKEAGVAVLHGIREASKAAGGGRPLAGATIKQALSNALGVDIEGMVQRFEGSRSKAYRDLGGNLTIGYGHLVKAGEKFGTLTKSQELDLLRQDLAIARQAVLNLVKVHLNQNQLAALEDFQFNTGKLAGSTLLKLVNQGRFAEAAQQFGRWDKVRVGNTYMTSQALLGRRLADQNLFQKPVTVSQKTDIHITGVSDPAAAGRETARQQNNVNGRLVRNLSGVIDSPGGNSPS